MAITLKAARVNVDLTQEEAAKAIGVTQNTVYRWEKGVSAPHIKYIPKICEVYKLENYNDVIFLAATNA